ncbi:MAG: glycosyltransferase family protein [Leadbetterella sp.]
MRVYFIIQGEGRGHQTQAIAFAEILRQNNHTVCMGMVGSTDNTLPVILKDQTLFEVKSFLSPVLVYDRSKLNLYKTVKNTFKNLSKYKKSLALIRKSIDYYNPDLIINFYEPLAAVYSWIFNKRRIPIISVAHQFFIFGQKTQRTKSFQHLFVSNYTRFLSKGSNQTFALTIHPSTKTLHTIIPPLIRSEIKSLRPITKGYILIYCTLTGVFENLIHQCAQLPHINFEVFVDKSMLMADIPSNVTLNPISSTQFLVKLNDCDGLITTAGFETVCEAIYLKKPTMLIPIPKHYEQHCNAKDFKESGFVYYDENNQIKDFLAEYKALCSQFSTINSWIDQTEIMILQAIGKLAPVNLS